ncbi:MAG: hypothetical protein ACF8PN_03505 [Phycisphaerales bacterium]
MRTMAAIVQPVVVLVLVLVLAMSLMGCHSPTKGQSRGEEPTIDRAEVYHRMMNTWVRVDYDHATLEAIFSEMERIGEVDFLVDWTGSLHASRTVSLSLDEPIRLVTALEMVLREVSRYSEDANWSLGETFVRVASHEALNQDKYIVAYPLNELLRHSPVFRDMPARDRDAIIANLETSYADGETDYETRLIAEISDIMTSYVHQFEWERNGGDGASLRYLNGVFLVNAADYIHRELGGYAFVGMDQLFVREPAN